jgi:hypothetical protein
MRARCASRFRLFRVFRGDPPLGPTQEIAKRKPILFWQYAVFCKALKSINAVHLPRKRTQFASLKGGRYLCSARTEPQPVASLLTTPWCVFADLTHPITDHSPLRSRRYETELVQLLVEGHAADAQLRRGAEAVIAVPLQRGGDLGPFDFVLGRGQCRPG